MDSMNRRQVRVDFSQSCRCCFKTLACETDWTIFKSRFQYFEAAGFICNPQVQSERTLNLRKVGAQSYGLMA